MIATRQPLPPATGFVRWVSGPSPDHRYLEITPVNVDGTKGEPQTYEVEPVENGYRLHNLTHAIRTGEFVSYRLTYWTNGQYLCDCPDARNRPERRCNCKHVRGLKAALRSDPF